MSFVKLLFAWAFSIAVCSVLATLWSSNGRPQGGFIEAILGIGVLIAIPSFMFALVVGWPIIAGLSGIRPAWPIPVVAMLLFSILMLGITAMMLPLSWRGASYALIGYAAVLGLVWGTITALTTSAN